MSRDSVRIKAVGLGFTVALGIWLITGLVSFFWVLASEQTVISLGLYLYILGILGVLCGAIVAGRKSMAQGWLHGLWVGLLLGLFGVILNLELVPELYSWGAIGRQILVWTLWGVTGGYLGAHFRSPESGAGKGSRAREKVRRAL
jgi:putative membrane protein (TIGR04086 family)